MDSTAKLRQTTKARYRKVRAFVVSRLSQLFEPPYLDGYTRLHYIKGMQTTTSKTFTLTQGDLTTTETVYSDGKVETVSSGTSTYIVGIDCNGNKVRKSERVSGKETRYAGRRLDLSKVAEARRDMGWREVA